MFIHETSYIKSNNVIRCQELERVALCDEIKKLMNISEENLSTRNPFYYLAEVKDLAYQFRKIKRICRRLISSTSLENIEKLQNIIKHWQQLSWKQKMVYTDVSVQFNKLSPMLEKFKI